MRQRLHIPALLVSALAIAAPLRCDAGSFTISPVSLELSGDEPAGMLVVRNTQDRPLVIQVQAFAWSHDGIDDTLAPTRELLATPPVVTLQPGAEQVVRVALRRAPAPARELAYRLLVREVPPRGPAEPGTLTVALQLSLPVFVAGANGAAPDVDWRLVQRNGELRLVAVNRGGAHLKIAKLEIAGVGRQWSRDVADYLLPGQRREWPVPEFEMASLSPAAHVLLSAQTQRGPLGAELALSGF